MSHPAPTRAPVARVGLAVVLSFVVAIHALPSDRQSVILGGLRNAGHIPLFMAITAVVWRLSRGHFFRTVVTVAVIALLAEISQLATGGETDWRDLVADGIGFVLMMGAIVLWTRPRQWSRTLALALVVAGLVPLATWSLAGYQRSRAMPCLADFSRPLLSSIQRPMNAQRVRSTPDALTLALDAKRYAGVRLLDPVADWSDYQELVIEFETEPAVPITLRVHDRDHTHEFNDRFNRTFSDGTANLAIALADIRTAPDGREMDLTRIEELTLFAVNPPAGTRLTLAAPCLRKSR